MEKLPKIGLPILIGIIILVIVVAKSAVTIDSGEAGVLFETFGKGWTRRNKETLEQALKMLE